MLRKTLAYSAGLIALYLVVYYGTQAGQVIDSATRGASTIVRTFQAR